MCVLKMWEIFQKIYIYIIFEKKQKQKTLKINFTLY